MKSFCLRQISNWTHHHDGWGFVLKHLNTLHNPYGIVCLDWVEGAVKFGKVPDRPWIGFAHNAITYPIHEEQEKYRSAIRPLSELVKTQHFAKCRGLYTFTDHTAHYLSKHLPMPVESLVHPMPTDVKTFNVGAIGDCSLVSVGQWMRRHRTLLSIKTEYRKAVLSSTVPGLETIASANHDGYEKILLNNIVFLDFYDVAACNVVLECIARATPLLVRRLPGCEEYLGKDYPLFYTNPDMASDLLISSALLDAHQYLLEMDKTKFSPRHFLKQIQDGYIATESDLFI